MISHGSEATPSSVPPPGAVRPSLLLMVALIGVALIYLPVLAGPFIWDDRLLAQALSELNQSGRILSLFNTPFWSTMDGASAAYYRPLTSLSLAVDLLIHGDNPAGLHLTNLALHLCNTVLLYRLGLRLKLPGAAAVVAAGLWAVLPRSTEAVAWISSRGDLLATTWVLSALIVFIPASRGRAFSAGLCLLAGLLAKEVALAGVLATLAWMGAIARSGARGEGQSAPWLNRAAWLCAPLLPYGALRALAGALQPSSVPLGASARLATIAEAVGRYVGAIVDPFQPQTLQGAVGKPAWGFVLLGVGALLTLVLGGLFAWRRRLVPAPATVMLMVLFASALGLVLHVIPLPLAVVTADRFLYLPSAALVLLLVRAAGTLRWSQARPVWALCAALFLGLAVRASLRVSNWTSESQFWITTVEDAPASPTGWLELGGVYYRAALYEHALTLYERGRDLAGPQRDLALRNIAACLGRVGRYTEARALTAELLQRAPADAATQILAARLALQDLDFESAMSHAALAVHSDPHSGEAQEFYAALPEILTLGSELGAQPTAISDARFQVRSGRNVQALDAIRRALRESGLAQEDLSSFEGYLLRFGSAADAQLVRAAVSGADPAALEPLVAQRLATLEELETAWPKVAEALPARVAQAP